MKKYLLTISVFLLLFLCTACGGSKAKQVTCKMNSQANITPEIIASLDDDGKVKEIEIHMTYNTEEEANTDFNSYKTIHGDNASIDKNVITIKNVHDENTFFGKQYSKTVGYTVEEFQKYLGNYTCE